MRSIALGLMLGLLSMSTARAALVDRGGGMIYDTVLNVTWLQDANYAQTSGYDADGRMNWTAANTWAGNLSYYDSVRGVNWDDWRLPTALNTNGTGPCSGTNCSTSELGHMFYTNLGGVAGSPVSAGSAVAFFVNLQDRAYWTSTSAPAFQAWGFSNIDGVQFLTDGTSQLFYSWAVRDGDVVPPVPLPAAAWLLLSGLGGLGWLGRRRRA